MNEIKNFLEKFYPREPFHFSFSRIKILLFFFLALLGGAYYYLRLQKEDELDLLKKQHEKIQSMVRNYMHDMSHADYNMLTNSEISNRLEKFKKELSQIDAKMNDIKNFWFLE